MQRRTARSASLLLALGASGGCGKAGPLFVEAPPWPQGSVIVAAYDGSRVELLASDAASGLELELSPGKIALEVLAFDERLDELTLSAGSLEANEAGCLRSCALARPAQTWRAPRDGQVDSSEIPAQSWSEVSGPSDAVLEALVGAADRCRPACRPLRHHFIPLSTKGAVVFVVPDGEADLLVGLMDGSLLRLAAEEQVTAVCGPSDFAPSAAHKARDASAVWLTTSDGRLATLNLAAQREGAACSIETVTTTPDRERVIRLSGPPTGEILELVGLSERGTAFHFSAGIMTALGRVALEQNIDPPTTTLTGAAVWRGRGRAFFSAGGPEVLELEGGGQARRMIEIPGLATQLMAALEDRSGRLIVAAHFVGLGTLAGDNLFHMLTSRTAYAFPGAIAELDGSLFFPVDNGLLAQHVPGGTDCELYPFGKDGVVTAIAPIGSKLVIADWQDAIHREQTGTALAIIEPLNGCGSR